ncbi:MAG: T9SS type A sorting domain-containing protein [Ignavibacteria bacterium]|nr:T9SS type A sorting domain-containing protein [Ignavibacteria bacterium]
MQASSGMGNIPVLSLTTNGNTIFAGSYFNFGGVYLTTNSGATWSQSTLNNRNIYSLVANGNNIFAGTYLLGVYYSSNNGASWSTTSLSATVLSLAYNNSYTYAGTELSGVYRTNDNVNWQSTSLNDRHVRSLAVNGNIIFAGTMVDGVYLSTNDGANWTQTSLNSVNVYALSVSGAFIFAGTNAGIYLSSNNGSNWIQTSLNNQIINVLAIYGNSIFAGTEGNGVFISNNNGVNWIQKNEGLGNGFIFSLCINNNYVFAGSNIGVYRRPIGELTNIHSISNNVLHSFMLYQNYPNPFNPTTEIKFDVPNSSIVNLIIFDALGKEVAALVDEELNAGEYSIDWNASTYPSGIYFYRLVAGEFTETKKMVLIK